MFQCQWHRRFHLGIRVSGLATINIHMQGLLHYYRITQVPVMMYWEYAALVNSNISHKNQEISILMIKAKQG
jgi:hypothetical protein